MIMSLEISTDNKWKNLLYGNEVPKKILDSEFYYMDDPEASDFIKYRGNYYNASDFMRISPDMPAAMKKWDGYLSDSFFSGILIKLSDDGDQYKIGTYMS